MSNTSARIFGWIGVIAPIIFLALISGSNAYGNAYTIFIYHFEIPALLIVITLEAVSLIVNLSYVRTINKGRAEGEKREHLSLLVKIGILELIFILFVISVPAFFGD